MNPAGNLSSPDPQPRGGPPRSAGRFPPALPRTAQDASPGAGKAPHPDAPSPPRPRGDVVEGPGTAPCAPGTEVLPSEQRNHPGPSPWPAHPSAQTCTPAGPAPPAPTPTPFQSFLPTHAQDTRPCPPAPTEQLRPSWDLSRGDLGRLQWNLPPSQSLTCLPAEPLLSAGNSAQQPRLSSASRGCCGGAKIGQGILQVLGHLETPENVHGTLEGLCPLRCKTARRVKCRKYCRGRS